MSESSTHIALVKAMMHWIETETNIATEMAILVASPNSPIDHQPPSIGGRIPDLYAQDSSLGKAIIGEAKTASDIETIHSRHQFSDYLQYLALHEHSMLIAAVPWYCVNQTHSLLRSIQKKTRTINVKLIVLEKLPG